MSGLTPILARVAGFSVLFLSALVQAPIWLHRTDDLVVFCQRVSPLSSCLFILTALIIILAVMASINQIHAANGHAYTFIILLLSVLVSFTFTVNKAILFYLFFEGSLIPIFLIVIGWGYQPERLRAGFALFFYTLVASLPLLLIVLSLSNQFALRRLDAFPATRLFPV